MLTAITPRAQWHTSTRARPCPAALSALPLALRTPASLRSRPHRYTLTRLIHRHRHRAAHKTRTATVPSPTCWRRTAGWGRQGEAGGDREALCPRAAPRSHQHPPARLSRVEGGGRWWRLMRWCKEEGVFSKQPIEDFVWNIQGRRRSLYTPTHTPTYIDIHLYTQTYTYIHTPMYTYIYIHLHLHTPIQTYIHLHTPTHTYTHLYTPVHIPTPIHLYTPTYTYTHLTYRLKNRPWLISSEQGHCISVINTPDHFMQY